MIYQTVNFSTFCDAFHNMGRSEQFSYEGKKALFDFLEGISLDVIALCCDFTEYTHDELMSEYNENGQYGDIEELMDHLNDHTIVIRVNDNLVILQAF